MNEIYKFIKWNITNYKKEHKRTKQLNLKQKYSKVKQIKTNALVNSHVRSYYVVVLYIKLFSTSLPKTSVLDKHCCSYIFMTN